jgi:hypothetical protein
MNSDVVVYRKDGITYVKRNGLVENITIKEFAKLLGKSENTILNHYKKQFPYNVVKKGIRLKLAIEEQITLIESFPRFKAILYATRKPVDKLSIYCEQVADNCEQSIKEFDVSLPYEYRLIESYFVNKFSFLAGEYNKDRDFLEKLFSGKLNISLSDYEKTLAITYQDQNRGPL